MSDRYLSIWGELGWLRVLDKRFFMSYLCNKQSEVYSVRLRAILRFTMGNLSFTLAETIGQVLENE